MWIMDPEEGGAASAVCAPKTINSAQTSSPTVSFLIAYLLN